MDFQVKLCLLLIWTILFVVANTDDLSNITLPEECFKAAIIKDATRQFSNFKVPTIANNDATLGEGWYRFSDETDHSLILKEGYPRYDSFVGTAPNLCGTSNPGTVIGKPTTKYGRLDSQLKVCFRDRLCFFNASVSCNCSSSVNISAINCYSYYVYKLSPTAANERYCTERTNSTEKDPAPPFQLTTDPLSKSVLLTWYSVNVNVTQYRIMYKFSVNGYSESKTVYVNISSPSTKVKREYDLKKLYPFISYTIELSEKTTKYGSVAKVTVKTAEGAPQAPVGNLTADNINSTTVRIRWTPIPIYLQGGVLVDYDVIFIRADDQQKKMQFTVQPVMTNTILHGLVPNTTYWLMVIAKTKVENGESAKLAFTTMIPEPSTPRSVSVGGITHNSARISWIEPEEPNELSQYVIRVSMNGKFYSSETVNKNVLSVKISGLEPQSNYTVQIYGFNNGTGAESSVHFRTTAKPEPKNLKGISTKTLLIILCIIIPLTVIILVVSICLFRRRRQRSQSVTKDQAKAEKLPLKGTQTVSVEIRK